MTAHPAQRRATLEETIRAIRLAIEAMDPDDAYAVAAIMSRTAAGLYGRDGHAKAYAELATQHARIEGELFVRKAIVAEPVCVPKPFTTAILAGAPSPRTVELCAGIDRVREMRAAMRRPSARAGGRS